VFRAALPMADAPWRLAADLRTVAADDDRARAIDAIPDLSADLHAAIFKAECANDLGNAG
jgi:hypothetical protein